MKLNKKKITAMAMAVMMAVSSAPATFAAEDVAVEQGEQQKAQQKTFVRAVSVVNESTVLVEYKNEDGTTGTENVPATLKHVDGTCQKQEHYEYELFYGETHTGTIVVGDYGDHKLTVLNGGQRIEKTAATCQHPGESYIENKCDVCGDIVHTDIQEIPQLDHKYGEPTVTYEAVTNCTVVDNKVVVTDQTLDATYNEIKDFGLCTECKNVNSAKKTTEEKTIKATAAKEEVVLSVSNVRDDVIKADMTVSEVEALRDDLIHENCAEDIVITWAHKDGNGDVVGTTREERIEAKHDDTETVYEFATKDDLQTGYNETTDKLDNRSCWKTIKYNEVIVCMNESHNDTHGCGSDCDITATKLGQWNSKEWGMAHVVSRTEKELAPAGKHTVDPNAKAKVDTYKADVEKEGAYDTLADWAAEHKDLLTVSTTATCTKAGKTTITMICQICNKPITDDVITVDQPALGHKLPEEPETLEKTDATCEKAGHIVTGYACTRCDYEEKVEDRIIFRKPHTNEEGVNQKNGTSLGDKAIIDNSFTVEFTGARVVDNPDFPYKKDQVIKLNTDGKLIVGDALRPVYCVEIKGYTNCTTCGNHKVDVTTTVKQGAGYVATDVNWSVKVADIVKQTADGVAGKITLDITADNGVTGTGRVSEEKTVTFPYYNSWEEYMNRVEEKPDEIKNGLVMDDDGVYRYYKDGEFDPTFGGLVEYNGFDFLVQKGLVATDYNGILNAGDEGYLYLASGMVQKQHTDLVKYDGAWFYVTNGRIDNNINGLVEYDGGKFVIANGMVATYYNGLWKDENGNGAWYFVAEGQVQDHYTGVVDYDGHKFELKDGKLVKQIA